MLFVFIFIIIIFILWIIKKYDNSNGVVGETRVIKKILLTPTAINNDKRFLVKAKIKQEYYKTPCGEYRWINKEWLD